MIRLNFILTGFIILALPMAFATDATGTLPVSPSVNASGQVSSGASGVAALIELHASSLTLAPVGIGLTASRPYTILRITNNADEPVTLHARACRWSFDEHDDVSRPPMT